MTKSYKIKEVMKVLLWMFAIPLIIATSMHFTGAEIKINETAVEGYFAIPILTFYLFCIESGIFIIGAFIYGVFTGKIYE